MLPKCHFKNIRIVIINNVKYSQRLRVTMTNPISQNNISLLLDMNL